MGDTNRSHDDSRKVHQHDFQSQQSEHHKQLTKRIEDEEGSAGKHLEVRQAESFFQWLLMQDEADYM